MITKKQISQRTISTRVRNNYFTHYVKIDGFKFYDDRTFGIYTVEDGEIYCMALHGTKKDFIDQVYNYFTYDVVFNDLDDSNSKGFIDSFQDCKDWIINNRGTGYFQDYKGGTVSIICNQTGETVYTKDI